MAETAAAEQLTSSLLHSTPSGNSLHQTPLEFRSSATTVDPVRIGNTLHRTTSETLRLTEPTLLHQTHLQPQLQQQLQQQTQEATQPQTVISALSDGSVLDAKKTSSFQITSVISSSVSNDGEDDSCGEVEDCQTDASDVGSQRQIQYEMILDTGMYMNDGDSGLSVTSIGVPVSIAQQASEGSGLKVEDKDHGWQGRFRVVKIESSEPFKRGRWLCMDFLDHPSIQPSLSKEEPGSGASSSASLSDHFPVHDDTGQSSQMHPQPLQGQQQGVSTVTPAAQPANPQQLNSSGVHMVTHSLSASASPASYSSSQQPQIQPVYQQSSTIPIYPVTSMPMMPQMSMQASPHSVQSLTMPILPPQPTVPPVAAAVSISALTSNIGSSYVQQTASTGLHNTGQQQPVPSSSMTMIQASTYSTPTVVGAQQYAAPSQSLQGIQPMTVPQQVVPQALPQPQLASTPPQPISLPQQPSTVNAAVPVSHVIPGSIMLQPQPLIVQAPQQPPQQPPAPLIQPGATVQHPVVHQTGAVTGHSSGLVPVLAHPGQVAQPGTVPQQQSVSVSISVPGPVPVPASMSMPVPVPVAVPVSMSVSMPMPISGPVTTFSQPGLMVSQATSVQQGPTPLSLATGMVQHPTVSVQGGSLQLGGQAIQSGGIISQQQQQHSGLTQTQPVGVLHHQPVASIPQLGGNLQPSSSPSQHPVPIQSIQPSNQLVPPSGGGGMTQSSTMPQSTTLLQHAGTLQQQPPSGATQSTPVIQQSVTGSVPTGATSMQTSSSMLQSSMATATLHAPGQSSGLMQSTSIQQMNSQQQQPQQQSPVMQQQSMPQPIPQSVPLQQPISQQMQQLGSIQHQQIIQQQQQQQQPQASPIQTQPIQQSQQQQPQQTLQPQQPQQPIQQQPLQQHPPQTMQQPLQQTMTQPGPISQQQPVQQIVSIQQPQQQQSPAVMQQPIQQSISVAQQSSSILQQPPLQPSAPLQQQQHLGVAQPSAGNLHAPMQQQQQPQQSVPASMPGLPMYMSQANFSTVSAPLFAAVQTNQISSPMPIVTHQIHQQPPQQQSHPPQTAQPPQQQAAQHSSQASTDEGVHPPPGEDHSSASGSSTVAIDNKIEQAMDLVKSHLMFAVREEVEVLKEKIAELMERIAFLESENSILRAAASQETLSQLSQIEPPFPPSGGDSNSGSGSGGTQGQNGTSAP